MHFSTVTSIDPPKFVENSNHQFSNKKKTKAYSPYSKKTVYQNKNNEAIEVELTKSHDYLTFSNIDSIWVLRKNNHWISLQGRNWLIKHHRHPCPSALFSYLLF